MRKKRGAIQLSTNFIVMLILTIVVFAFGIVMISRIFSFAEDERLRLDQQTESMIEGALDRGERVFIPRERRTVPAGDTKVFGMGILNVLGTGQDKFGILVKFHEAYDGDTRICSDPCPTAMNNALLSATETTTPNGLIITKTIRNNEQEKFLIGVKVPPSEDKGTYIYNVTVAYDSDSPQNGIDCDDFGATGTAAPDCTGIQVNSLYDKQLHKIYVVVP